MTQRARWFLLASSLAASCALPHIDLVTRDHGAGGEAGESANGDSGSAGKGTSTAGHAGKSAGSAGAPSEGGAAGDGGGEPGNGGAPEVSAGSGGQPGAGSGGSAGTVGGGAGSAGAPPTDTLPWRALNVTTSPGTIPVVRTIKSGDADPQTTAATKDQTVQAGLDTRAAPLGKLVLEFAIPGGTSGGYWQWAGKRGFHVLGIASYQCKDAGTFNSGTAYAGNCRGEAFDGVDRTTEMVISVADSVEGRVKASLKYLHTQFPSDDWGYFLNKDDSVRWSDVILSGFSSAGTTAARAGKLVRASRVVSRSGLTDNACGDGKTHASEEYNPESPPYLVNCDPMVIADWLTAPSLTPIDRFFAIQGTSDGQYGQALFAMFRMGYVGSPVNIVNVAPPYGGSHRLYATQVGHVTFDSGNYDKALELAYGVPPANQGPTF